VLIMILLTCIACITLGTYLVSITTGTYLVNTHELDKCMRFARIYLLDKLLVTHTQECSNDKSPQRVEQRQHYATPQRECDTHSTAVHAHDTQSKIQNRAEHDRHKHKIQNRKNCLHAPIYRWSPARNWVRQRTRKRISNFLSIFGRHVLLSS